MNVGFLEATIVREDGTKIIENTYLEFSEDGYPILFSDADKITNAKIFIMKRRTLKL